MCFFNRSGGRRSFLYYDGEVSLHEFDLVKIEVLSKYFGKIPIGVGISSMAGQHMSL